MKVKSSLLVAVAVVPAVLGKSRCPDNCLDELKPVCEMVDGVMDPIPFVPEWVKGLVANSICFPKDSTPSENSLCRKDCKILKTCNYVDGILGDIVVLPEFVRKITDTMICDIADLSYQGTNFAATSHCPSTCTEEGAAICNTVENVLESLQLLPDEILNLVGQAICDADFVEKKHALRAGQSLCPEKCRDDELHKVCALVDDILQATPTPIFVRNITDQMICAIGELIPKDQHKVQLVKIQDVMYEEHCPSNCDDNLKPICEGVENILDPIPMIPKFVRNLVGHAICFPKDSGSSEDSLCPKECSNNEQVVKVCNYVDNILHDVPVPTFVRNITDHAICAFAANAEAYRVSSIQLEMN